MKKVIFIHRIPFLSLALPKLIGHQELAQTQLDGQI